MRHAQNEKSSLASQAAKLKLLANWLTLFMPHDYANRQKASSHLYFTLLYFPSEFSFISASPVDPSP